MREAFQTTLHWSALIAVGLFGFLIGVGFAPEIAHASMDSGTATLFGAALGAAITVAGSIWGVRYSNRVHAAGFKKLAAATVLAIRDECYRLLHLSELEEWPDNDQFAANLKGQLEKLKAAIAIFGQLAPYSEIQDYDARLSIFHLERTINEHVSTLDRELSWVADHQTKAVLDNARRNVSNPAYELGVACVSAARDLGARRKLDETDQD